MSINAELRTHEDVLQKHCTAGGLSSGTSIETNQTGVRRSIKRQWIQNATHVNITLYVKNLKEDEYQLKKYESTNQFGVILLPTGREPLEFVVDNLFDSIEPSETEIVITPLKVEVRLKKVRPGIHWMDLESTHNTFDIPIALNTLPTFSGETVYKKQPKQWDNICNAELKDDSAEGEDALNKLFCDIYSKGDEDSRRAMIKSFQTSGGTVLSTNWNEVKDADYEKDIKAPEGQEVRKWT